jgi:hypothetical protein
MFVCDFNLTGYKNLQGGYPLRLFFETGGAPAEQGFNLLRVSFYSHGSRDSESSWQDLPCMPGSLLHVVIDLFLLLFKDILKC